MNSSQDDQIDRLLSDWATKTDSSMDRLESLKVSIVEQPQADSQSACELAELPEAHNHWRVAAAFSVATAAALLLTFTLWKDSDPTSIASRDVKQIPLLPDGVPLPNSVVSTDHQRRLWQEHYSVFGAELVWLADRGDQTEIGLSETATDSRSRGLVDIHLILWSRSAAEGKWQKAQAFRVIAASEHLVQVPSGEGTAEPLEIWVYPLDQEMVSIDLNFRPDLPGAPKFNQSVLQRLGDYTQVGGFEKDGIEYRLYQTADLIPDGNLG